MSQMKLAITRDSRAASMVSPAKGLEAKKLKSPSTGKSLKGVKGKPRPQPSSCHQTLLKFVSKANSKPKILKTLSENSVQVEVKPNYFSSGSAVQTSDNSSKVIATLSENAVIINDKCKTMSDSEVKPKVEKVTNSDHCVSSEANRAAVSSNPSKSTNLSTQLLSSNIVSSTTNTKSTASETLSETSQSTPASLPTIMSSHPVSSIQQSHFKPVPSKISPTPKPVTVQVLPISPKKQHASAAFSSDINSSPSIVKCTSNVLTVKTSPPALAKHLHQNSDLVPVSTVTSSKENSIAAHPDLVGGKCATADVASSFLCAETIDAISTPPNPKKSRPATDVGVASGDAISTPPNPKKSRPATDVASGDAICSPPNPKKSRPATDVGVASGDAICSPPNAKKSRRQTAAMLPVSRVRTIMKTNFQSSKSGPQLGQESVPIVCKAAELFIAALVREADKGRVSNSPKREIDYSDLAASVNRHSKLRFLHEILPKKVLAKDCLSSSSSSSSQT